MRRVGRTVEGNNSRDDLDRLVVRDIVRLSLCEKTSPLNSLSGDGSTSSANTASFSPFREQILTFFRLQALAFIVRDLRSFRLLFACPVADAWRGPISQDQRVSVNMENRGT